MKRKRMILIISALLIFVIIIQIIYTNVSALKTETPVIMASAGEWVPLKNNFMYEKAEGTLGYAINISGAEYLSVDHFKEKYGVTSDLSLDPKDQILILNVQIRNENSPDGKLPYASWHVFCSDFTEHVEASMELITITEPQFAGNVTPAVSLSQGKEYLLQIPYVIEERFSSLFQPGHMCYVGITKYPERTLIQLSIPD